jgi:hypothetical protein
MELTSVAVILMYLVGTLSESRGQIVPELVVATAGGRNYNYTPFDATVYRGPDTFTSRQYLWQLY